MDTVAALDEQIDALNSEINKIDAQILALLAPWEAWNGFMLQAQAERMLRDAQDALTLEASIQPLRDQLHQLWTARNAAECGVNLDSVELVA